MELLEATNYFKEILEISDISESPDKIKEIILNNQTEIFKKWILKNPDLTCDSLQPIFQYYLADRKGKMQDYTSKSLALAACMVVEIHKAKSVYDMCAGSGALTIQAWNINPKCRFICQEYDERVIPFLIFNLAIRNMNAIVIRGDVLSEEQFEAYALIPGTDFSQVAEIPAPVDIKCDCCISNPPYNLKWNVPVFSALNDRYKYGVPPSSNANYAFISAAIQAADNAVLILPQSALSSEQNAEAEIRENLIEANLIDAIIQNPGDMFECTNIGTCLYSLKRNKQTVTVEMVDMQQHFTEEIRLQNGQFGGTAHTNRTYQKTVKTYSEENINSIIGAIANRRNKTGFSWAATPEMLKSQKNKLVPSAVIPFKYLEPEHREYYDIVTDYNKIIEEKNACKLVINETLAKAMSLPCAELKSDMNIDGGMYELMERLSGIKPIKPDYISFTKNKGECMLKANDPEHLSTIFKHTLMMWKQHLAYLNEQENIILAEYRDAILPELMSGKIEI